MATQEQDFNQEVNRQAVILYLKDSHGVTIDLTEVQCAQVLQTLLTLAQLRRLPPASEPAVLRRALLRLLGLPEGEMQDVEVNSLAQGQAIHVEGCTDVTIRVRQLEVEKVVELGLTMLRLMDGGGFGTRFEA
jgi:hypothetical protein